MYQPDRYQRSRQFSVIPKLTWRERLSEAALWAMGLGWLGFLGMVAFALTSCAAAPEVAPGAAPAPHASQIIVADSQKAGEAAVVMIRDICPLLPVLGGTLGVIAAQKPEAADLQKATQMLAANQALIQSICAIFIHPTAPVVIAPNPATGGTLRQAVVVPPAITAPNETAAARMSLPTPVAASFPASPGIVPPSMPVHSEIPGVPTAIGGN